MSKSKLQQAIDSVNRRYAKGLNDDDQVVRMIEIDRQTKGHTFSPEYDTYKLITDEERLQDLVNKYGYWSQEVKFFNSILTKKGGYDYMQKLNQKHTGTQNGKTN
jgi:hypothetical protein